MQPGQTTKDYLVQPELRGFLMRCQTFLLALTGVLACSDAGVTKFNTDPTAELSSHGDGDTVREGYAETLRGTVGDANHGF